MRQIATLAAHVRSEGRSVNFDIGQPGTRLFVISWFLVTSLGLVPLAEMKLHRATSVPPLAIIAFFIAAGSAAALRQRYTWLGIALHIYSQIAIWLSLTFCSMALVMSAMAG